MHGLRLSVHSGFLQMPKTTTRPIGGRQYIVSGLYAFGFEEGSGPAADATGHRGASWWIMKHWFDCYAAGRRGIK